MFNQQHQLLLIYVVLLFPLFLNWNKKLKGLTNINECQFLNLYDLCLLTLCQSVKVVLHLPNLTVIVYMVSFHLDFIEQLLLFLILFHHLII